MENIGKQSIIKKTDNERKEEKKGRVPLSSKGYILLESLLSLVLLTIVTAFMLEAVNDSQKSIADDNHQIEVLNTAKMALDAEMEQLTINGVSVRIEQSDKQVVLFDKDEEVLRIEIQSIQK